MDLEITIVAVEGSVRAHVQHAKHVVQINISTVAVVSMLGHAQAVPIVVPVCITTVAVVLAQELVHNATIVGMVHTTTAVAERAPVHAQLAKHAEKMSTSTDAQE